MKFEQAIVEEQDVNEGWKGTRGIPDGSGPAPGRMGRGIGTCNRSEVLSAVRRIAASKGLSDYEIDRIISDAIANSSSTQEAIEKAKKYIMKEEKIDQDAVYSAVQRAAVSIFGKADKKKIQTIVKAAVPLAKDTEDAIQIGINMMRGRKK